MRYPRCAGLAAPGIPAAGSDISAAGSDIPAASPLAYPPQALTCRLHSPWHARRIAVIGWLHCPDMRKPPFEMYRMVSKGGFRTEMALVMCFINGLKRTGCFQTAVFAHRASALFARRHLVGAQASCGLRGKKSDPRRMVLGLGRELMLSRDRSGARVVGGRSGARVVAYRFQMSRADERGCVHQRRGSNANMQRNSLGPRRMTMRRGPRTSGHVIGRRSERAPLGLDL